jgi:hypothetical protein
MRKVSIAALKRQLEEIASKHRQGGGEVNISQLMRKQQMPRSTFNDLLAFSVPHWREELQIVDGRRDSEEKRLTYSQYEFATKLLALEDHLPNAENLSEMLDMSLAGVYDYMNRHSDLAASIGFCSKIEDRVYHAGRKVRFRGRRVTRIAIAMESGLSYTTVKNVLKKRPDFIEKLIVQRSSSQGQDGVGKRLQEKQVRSVPKQPRPDWVRDTHSIRTMTFPASATTQEKLVMTLAARHAYDCKQITGFRHNESKGHRLSMIRTLTMYLLINDAGLSPKDCAMLYGYSRRTGSMMKRIAAIEPDMLRSCSQKELKVLRSKYLQ